MPLCEHCRKNEKQLYKMSGYLQNGQPSEVNLCHECSYKFIQGGEWFHSSRGLINSGTGKIKINDERPQEKVGSGGWTSIVKIINVFTIIGTIVAGIALGGSIGEEIGCVIGGVIGLFAGVTVVAMSMLFVEISEKLSMLINEVREVKKNL